MSIKLGKDFRFGFSIVGVQHEMGLPGSEFVSDWVLWLHDQENIVSGLVSGDFPENGPGYWHLYRQDHDIAERLGMDAMWITIEWARIFPRPTTDVVVPIDRDSEGIKGVYIDVEHIEKLRSYADRDALRRYREIIEDWKSRGGMVIVNLFHWSLPIWLHDPIKVRKLGIDRAPAGWVDEETVVEYTKFAGFVAHELGDVVDMWYTMNEPNVVASLGYIQIQSGFPPGYLDIDCYRRVVKHLAEAHARGYEAVKLFSKKPIGIVESIASWIPLGEGDRDAAEKGFRYNLWPIEVAVNGYIDGVYRDDLKGHLDWIGLNYYTRNVVVSDPRALQGFRILPGYGYGCTPRGISMDGRPCSDFGWEIYPEGIYDVLKKLWDRYRLPIYVTENGVADAVDTLRPHFIVSHLYQIHRAKSEGVDVRGYFHWNLIDNLEWAQGYRMRFGLVHVDFETKKRYLRPSALLFREIASRKEIPDEFMHMAYPPRYR